MRCNLFRPIGAGDNRMGTFLMFSQYTDDITKEQSMKSTYRVIPSRFVVMNLNLEQMLNNTPLSGSRHVSAWIEQSAPGYPKYQLHGNDFDIEGVDNIIPQILQSYFENSISYIRNVIDNPNLESNEYNVWDVESREFSSELFWRTLHDWGLINKVSIGESNGTPEDDPFEYFDEIKYIGDINIHSNHIVGSYSYDEIFCHIPAKADEYYYRLNTQWPIGSFEVESENSEYFTRHLEEWTDVTYPINMPLKDRAITYHAPNSDANYVYRVGGIIPEFDIKTYVPVPRHASTDENIDYKFNAIAIFYDVLYNEPGDDPRYLHRNRPMGIYLCGPVKLDDNGIEIPELQNTFTKYVTNNDAFGQGASFGLRIMTRYTPTPNSSTYTIEVDTQGDDYETITQAMGGIADAISGINRLGRDQRSMFQAYKDHLAMFRNRRVNVPYPREVSGKMYWFVNGRNTGQPCSVEVPEPTPPEHDYDNVEILNSEHGNIEVVQFIDIPYTETYIG